MPDVHVSLDADERMRERVEGLQADPLADPAAVLRDAAERTQVLREVLDELPGRYGEVLEWKYLEEQSVEQIARRLRASLEATQSTCCSVRGSPAFGAGGSAGSTRPGSRRSEESWPLKTDRTSRDDRTRGPLATRLPSAAPAARARVQAAVEARVARPLAAQGAVPAWRAAPLTTEAVRQVATTERAAAPPPCAAAAWPLALAASVLVGLVGVGAAWQAGVSAQPAVAVAEQWSAGRVVLERARPFGLRGRRAARDRSASLWQAHVIATGADGAALLRLGDGLTLRLAARFAAALRGRRSRGARVRPRLRRCRSAPRLQPLALATPFGTVLAPRHAVRGRGSARPASRSRCAKGACNSPAAAPGPRCRPTPASRCGVDPRGAVARATLRRDDARWDWLAALPAPFALEGATLASFLDWYARERGRQCASAMPTMRRVPRRSASAARWPAWRRTRRCGWSRLRRDWCCSRDGTGVQLALP